MSADAVTFPEGQTGSTLLRAALDDAVRAFPETFRGFALPREGKAFKREWPEAVGEFEVRRASSPDRLTIARRLAGYLPTRTQFGTDPLAARLASADAAEPSVMQGTAPPGWVPEITWGGEIFAGARIAELADRMREACQLSEAAATALRWVATERLQEPLVLTDQRFALLGAGAELAPTPYLLKAGARVLWVDPQVPPQDPAEHAGTLVHVANATDLLTETPAIRAAVVEESAQGPLHLGLYAYAPGRGRELRLTAAMNAIAGHVDPASITLLVSPTTPGEVPASCRDDRARRTSRRPAWQGALASLGALGEDSHHAHGDVQIARSIVGLQGPTYQAAQYLGKMMVAEVWAADRSPMRVSANVAGITHTKSLEHPLFLAGFLGAPSFGIHIFDPEQTRVLMTLLMLHDLFGPDAPTAEASPEARMRRVVGQTIHGGVRSAPYALDPTIRVAAMIGLVRRPSLLGRLARGE